ncbi:ABC transporter ATP-binding protein [Methanocorpusculum parvum]|uniref:ABC transporter domain-containing protein n=1 Tax=Methanocorpusculum parvum TaxID=2193 RepID=A0AAX0Q9Y2_9EURY|nr:ATP-binding cassette domain-containing protein [Methanocorpusculum parvum]PAV10117.1 hypothetical protein ASJ83_06590 [Methanocorpusculum parvum]
MKLEVRDLGFHYQKQERMIFSDVSFGIDKGEVISILGTNGAGKSTLLNCMANLYRPIRGGERQMVTIARVLAQQPDVILLDEPTAHLDYGNQIRMTRLVRKLADSGYAIILTTHMPDHVIMLQDKVGILDHDGRFTFGKAEDILSDSLLSNLYSVDLKLVYIDEAKRDTCVPFAY